MMYQQLYEMVLKEHRKVFEAQPVEDLEALMEAVKGAGRIFVFGAGREGIAARSFAMRLMHLGKETHWLLDDTVPGMHEGDLFLAVNGSGKIGFIDYFLDQAQKTGAKVAVITGAPKERTPSQADVNVFRQRYTKEPTQGSSGQNSRWATCTSSICFCCLTFWL